MRYQYGDSGFDVGAVLVSTQLMSYHVHPSMITLYFGDRAQIDLQPHCTVTIGNAPAWGAMDEPLGLRQRVYQQVASARFVDDNGLEICFDDGPRMLICRGGVPESFHICVGDQILIY
ncbi:MAG: hypothetical protein AAFR38_00480 [Planctomycetota bacterium]